MCADSPASSALAGCTRSPRSSSTAVTGCWASHSISRSGCSLRSSSAIATSRRAWPRPIGEEMYSARLARAGAALPAPRRRGRAQEVAQQQVDLDGVAPGGHVPGVLERHQRAVRHLRQRLPLRVRAHEIQIAVDHERGAGDARARLAHRLARGQPEPARGVRQHLRVGVERPRDAVLDLLGGMGLVDALREEELEEAAVVPAPVVAVVLRPPLVGVERLVERVLLRAREGSGASAIAGPMQTIAVDALGVLGGEDRGPPRAARQGHEARVLGGGGVHHRERVEHELVGVVGRGARRAVRAAVAAPVEGDHPAVARQVGDLPFQKRE